MRRLLMDALLSLSRYGERHGYADEDLANASRHLRQAVTAHQGAGEHPEDRCEECLAPNPVWSARTADWERATGRDNGGPVLCPSCFHRRWLENRRVR